MFVETLFIGKISTLTTTGNQKLKQLISKRRCIYRDFWWVEIYVVDSAAGQVNPARGESLFNGLERYIEVDD